MTSPPAKRGHHHGNLREALIDAGISLLASEGLEGLSLRKCAALAGVSHAAPAHHFAGLQGLLLAIAARGFSIFAQTMEGYAAQAPETPQARLVAICEGYYRFALDHGALFDLMFRQIRPLDADDEEFREAGTRAYGVLAEACAPFIAPGQDPEIVEVQVWALVHGYTVLAQVGKLRSNRPQPALADVLGLLSGLEQRGQI